MKRALTLTLLPVVLMGCKPAHQTPESHVKQYAKQACTAYLKDNIERIAKYDGYKLDKLKARIIRTGKMTGEEVLNQQGYHVELSGFSLVNGFGAARLSKATCMGVVTYKDDGSPLSERDPALFEVNGDSVIYASYDPFKANQRKLDNKERDKRIARAQELAEMNWQQRVDSMSDSTQATKCDLIANTLRGAGVEVTGSTDLQRELNSVKSRDLIDGAEYIKLYKEATNCK
ncbi:hypothetical protein [Vibrio owensii]|uniref:hypothetical protein n=1 Tax=Vibrio owensii TaxID=696485 RepID=UPI0018F18B44|nr:hypothetical protein [Vibrio owensii]